jgi:hypothetical protein
MSLSILQGVIQIQSNVICKSTFNKKLKVLKNYSRKVSPNSYNTEKRSFLINWVKFASLSVLYLNLSWKISLLFYVFSPTYFPVSSIFFSSSSILNFAFSLSSNHLSFLHSSLLIPFFPPHPHHTPPSYHLHCLI